MGKFLNIADYELSSKWLEFNLLFFVTLAKYINGEKCQCSQYGNRFRCRNHSWAHRKPKSRFVFQSVARQKRALFVVFTQIFRMKSMCSI